MAEVEPQAPILHEAFHTLIHDTFGAGDPTATPEQQELLITTGRRLTSLMWEFAERYVTTEDLRREHTDPKQDTMVSGAMLQMAAESFGQNPLMASLYLAGRADEIRATGEPEAYDKALEEIEHWSLAGPEVTQMFQGAHRLLTTGERPAGFSADSAPDSTA